MKEKELQETKEKLVRYLYPTKQLGKLMCEDIYQELLEIIPLECCISKDNLNEKIHKKNFEFVRWVIKGFLLGNVDYQQVFFNYYKHNNLDWIIRDILIGLVLYVSTLSDEFNNIDIIKDK